MKMTMRFIGLVSTHAMIMRYRNDDTFKPFNAPIKVLILGP